MTYVKETFIEEDRRYKKHCTQDNDAWVPFKVGILGPHTVLPASLATAAQCSFCSGSRSCGTNFAMTGFMPRSCVNISDTVGISRSASSSHTVSHWSLLIAASTHSTFSGVLLVAGLPGCGSLSTDSWPCLKHLCHTFIWAAFIASSPKAFWITWTVSVEECSTLMLDLIQIRWSTHSVILSVTATQSTCSLNGVYHPQWLAQWS